MFPKIEADLIPLSLRSLSLKKKSIGLARWLSGSGCLPPSLRSVLWTHIVKGENQSPQVVLWLSVTTTTTTTMTNPQNKNKCLTRVRELFLMKRILGALTALPVTRFTHWRPSHKGFKSRKRLLGILVRAEHCCNAPAFLV